MTHIHGYNVGFGDCILHPVITFFQLLCNSFCHYGATGGFRLLGCKECQWEDPCGFEMVE